MNIRALVNWFLSPSFMAYELSDYDLRRQAAMICEINKTHKVVATSKDNFKKEHTLTIQKLNQTDYSEDSYLNPILELQKTLACGIKFIDYFLIHGSLSTMDYVKGWSDLDTWVVINDEALNDPQNLVELYSTFKELNNYLIQIDSIAHHGYITLLRSNLANYKNSIMPIEVLQKSKALTENRIIKLKMVKSLDEELHRLTSLKSTFFAFEKSGVFKHHPFHGKYLSKKSLIKKEGMYQLKYLIGVILSIPSLYFSAIGKPTYKKDSFEPFMQEFGLYADIIVSFSEIRKEWSEREKFPYTPNKIPYWVWANIPKNFINEILLLLDVVCEKIKNENE